MYGSFSGGLCWGCTITTAQYYTGMQEGVLSALFFKSSYWLLYLILTSTYVHVRTYTHILVMLMFENVYMYKRWICSCVRQQEDPPYEHCGVPVPTFFCLDAVHVFGVCTHSLPWRSLWWSITSDSTSHSHYWRVPLDTTSRTRVYSRYILCLLPLC